MSRSKNMKHVVTLSLALAFLGAGAATAEAAPAIAAVRMQPKHVADLKTEITKARVLDARSFALVNQIVTNAPAADARARGGKAATALTLSQLGPSALYPMLEMLAIEAPHGIDDAHAPKVRRDLIEAVGLLKSPKALPVLTTILEDASEDAATTRTTAEAIARIGTDDAVTKLLAALDASSGERTQAIVAGIGESRRLRVAEALASRLRSGDDAMARVAARSLGRAGNAWAWKTLADRGEEAVVRKTAAAALVEAYVRRDGEARQAASNALMVVDAPETPALIAGAKRSASPEVAKALDDLAARFARNPAR